MKKFVITSPGFKGQAEIVYKPDGTLASINMIESEMPGSVISAFKSTVPVMMDDIEAAFKGTRAVIVAGDFEVSFGMFWNKYGKKLNKIRCMKLWEKMELTMKVKAYYGITAYDKYLKHEGWRNKADPETYLRNQYWENEYK
jgi:hypothetical protein